MSWRLLTATVSSIGYPARYRLLRILDAHMQSVPPGAARRSHLTGIQLAQGYLGRPDLYRQPFYRRSGAVRTDVPVPGRMRGALAGFRRGRIPGAQRRSAQNSGQRIFELGVRLTGVMQTLPDVEQAVAHACVFNQVAATGGDARQSYRYLVSHSGLPLDFTGAAGKITPKLPRAYGAGCVLKNFCQLAA